jgi:two-component system, LytTR family, sensor histidine kinase AlgZ
MHPILARGGRLGPYLMAWVPLAALLAGLTRLAAGAPWGEAATVALPLAALYAFICLAAWYPCRLVPIGPTPLARVVAIHAVAAALSALLWLSLAVTWVVLLDQFPAFADVGERFPSLVAVLVPAGLLLYVLAAALHYLVIAFEEQRQAERRELELEVTAREAELKALRAQIDPHFLFNAINSIAALTTAKPAAAREMCVALAQFLRESLRVGGCSDIPLAEELALAGSYLAIEQVRFGSRLRVEEQVEDACRHCSVPPLILQPLVENAVSRGIAGLIDGGVVRIAARLAGERLSLAVENPFDHQAPSRKGEGVGLANVRERLAAVYKGEAEIEVAAGDGLFRVRLEMPAAPPARVPETREVPV